MSTTASIPLTLIDLPDDILTEICDIINDQSLTFVGLDLLNLLLAHRRFSQTTKLRIEKHQHYLRMFLTVVIDTPTGWEDAKSNVEVTAGQSEMFTTRFDTAVEMLIAMHRDTTINCYVRSLVYIATDESPDLNRKHAALEAFDNDEKSLEEWTQQLKPTQDCSHRGVWLENLLQRDNGEGLALLLPQLSNLNTLQLEGAEDRWLGLGGVYEEQNGAHRFWLTPYCESLLMPRLALRRLVLRNVDKISDAFRGFDEPTQVDSASCTADQTFKQTFWR